MLRSANIIFPIFSFIELYSALPYDFCVPPLNISDCGMEPTPVFTYYKPGSRCEIELWRGCPTLNKFTNEFECSHYCIGRLTPSFSAEANGLPHSNEHNQNQCHIPIDLDDCGGDETQVYTFDVHEGTCVKVTWNGCDTVNKFDDEESCMEACREFHQDEDSDDTTENTAEEYAEALNEVAEEETTRETTKEPEVTTEPSPADPAGTAGGDPQEYENL